MTKEHEYQATKQWGEVRAATGKRKGEYIISGAIEWETDKAIKIGQIWHKPEYEWEHIENPYRLKEKIINHAKTEYSSSPHEFDNEQLDLIIEHDCECDGCGKSIFEMDDFPEVVKEDDRLLCEECYDDEYREICPLCENSWEKSDMTEYFFITKETSKQVHREPGLYKILKYPFYYGDCVFGFDAFFDDAIEKVSDLDITEAYAMRNPNNKKDILLDCICPDCATKYTRKDFFIKAEPRYCILVKSERDKLFADYSDERLHQVRQDMIHRRITFRGMLQAANL